MYGYQESSEVAAGSGGGKFGLNQGLLVTKFEYNATAGKDGAEMDAIDFTVKAGDKEFRHRFFPISKVFAKEGGEITDITSAAYKEGAKKEVEQLNATLSDIVKCFVSADDLKQALLTPIASFKDYASILQRLVQGTPNWNTTPVDVFLQYQWQPQGENTRTFLELPKNVKHGTFITKAQIGVFAEDRTDSHVKYVNAEGITHPFKRGDWFVKSAFANPTIIGGAAPVSAPTGATTGPATTW